MEEYGAHVGTSHTFPTMLISRTEGPLQDTLIAVDQHTHTGEHPVIEERAPGEMDTMEHDNFTPAMEPTLPGEKVKTVADENMNKVGLSPPKTS